MTIKEFIENCIVKNKIKFKSVYTHYDYETERNCFLVIIENETFPFFKGLGLKNAPPTIIEFLPCASSDCQAGEMSFEEFCSEFGYNEDSRKAYVTWECCVEMTRKMKKVFGTHYSEFLELTEE